MKPDHYKEFNAKHAKAGAPYCQRNGLAARIGIWDAKHDEYPLICVASYFDQYGESSCTWTKLGARHGGAKNDSDLVMLPLGYCEGKPVFVGDKLVYINSVIGSIVMDAECRHFVDFKWTRTAPVIPKFKEVFPAFNDEGFVRVTTANRVKLETYWKALDEYEATK